MAFIFLLPPQWSEFYGIGDTAGNYQGYEGVSSERVGGLSIQATGCGYAVSSEEDISEVSFYDLTGRLLFQRFCSGNRVVINSPVFAGVNVICVRYVSGKIDRMKVLN